MCQVLPPLLKPDYPKQTFLEKAPPPTLHIHIKLAVSHILKAMKPKFPQIKPYLASLGILENPYYGKFNLKVCVKCDNLCKNLPLLYLHIQTRSNSSTVMHFTVLITASSDSTVSQQSGGDKYGLTTKNE